MQLLKAAGSYEILQTPQELETMMLRLERVARICYQSQRKEITPESAAKLIQKIMDRTHESVIEHSLITVIFSNISRGFTHEMVRHRLAAFSQESTRYIDYAKEGQEPDLQRFSMHCVAPPHQDEQQKVSLEDGREMSLREIFSEEEKFYRGLRKLGWPPQDARQVLPIGIKSQIAVSANFREWRHILKMRTAKPAHWEIRSVMCPLLEELKSCLPVIFADFQKKGIDNNGVPYYTKTTEPGAKN